MARPPGQFDRNVKRCLAIIREAPPGGTRATNAHLAQQLGCSRGTVARFLKELARRGLIRRTVFRYVLEGRLRSRRVMVALEGDGDMSVPPKASDELPRSPGAEDYAAPEAPGLHPMLGPEDIAFI
jgi:DNA-binding Lrp family transcriptional regulator